MTKDPNKKHTKEDLDQLYTDADSCDKEIFAEMRSNVLLVAGEHYSRNRVNFQARLRDMKDVSEQQKVRLTKNHIQKIIKLYANNVISQAPGVGFSPANESELQDQKAAELHKAVWQDAREKYELDEKVEDWCDNFFQIGEVATKIFYDPNGGSIKAYEQKVDEGGSPLFIDDNGNEVSTPPPQALGQDGQPQPIDPSRLAHGKPIYSGGFVFEDVYGFNLLRMPEAKTHSSSSGHIIRKMVGVGDLIAKFPEHKDKIISTKDETFMIFDGNKGGYRKVDAGNECMLREFYFRPSHIYPRGYFYIMIEGTILAEGPLPGGIYPIVIQECEKFQTTPRGRSPVKTMRPYQAEINRTGSKIAETQITLGDDKVFLPNGGKMSPNTIYPGIRSYNLTSGGEPVVLAGRDGAQYLPYMQSVIGEMYAVMGVVEDSEEKQGQIDPYTMLFKAASTKKRHQRYIRKFERYLVRVCKAYLKLAKEHLNDQDLIYAVGRKEAVNIAEFKNMNDLCYIIKVEPQSDDIETKFGKQLMLNNILQYSSGKLEKEDIGKLINAMPYANGEKIGSDFTIDDDNATNDILALDRGQQPIINKDDNHPYVVKRLTNRKRQSDFQTLPPQVQQMYDQAIQIHQNMQVEKLAALKAAESEFIPTGGYMVVVDLYVPSPDNPNKTQRARMPYESLSWLMKQLESQGNTQQQLEMMNTEQLAQVQQQLSQVGARPGAAVPPIQNTSPQGMAAPQQMAEQI